MSVTVTILDGPLPALAPFPIMDGQGAALVFEGIVRGKEAGRTISALEYETYEPMAQRMLARIGEEIAAHHGLLSLAVEHSRGVVPVGACSFRLVIRSKHRKEALAAMDEFIDRLKKDVPIWKKPGA